MNSIKNAIVTVTLLAVGYGSYIVLSEPEPKQVGLALPADPSSPDVDVAVPLLDVQQGSAMQSSPTADQGPGFATGGERAGQALPDFSQTPPNPPRSTPINPVAEPIPNQMVPVGQEPTEVAVTAPQPIEIAAPNKLDFPELPPLPGFTNDASVPNLTSSGTGPRTNFGDGSAPDEPVDPAAPFDAQVANRSPAASEFTPANIQPPVAGSFPPTSNGTQAGTQELQSLEAASVGASNPVFDKTATMPATPQEIDIQPSDASPTLEPIMPQVDPSLATVSPPPSEGGAAFENSWQATQQYLQSQQMAEALQTLTPWASNETLNQEQKQRCLSTLDQLAGAVVYSRSHTVAPPYLVQPGETLDEIANKHQVPLQLLAKINGISAPYALSTGETLKVVKGPFRAEVSLSKQQLTLFTEGFYAGRFRVEIGPDLPREEAVYEVGEKLPGRAYFDRRSGTEVPQGEPNNRYGSYWLGLRGEHITTGHSVGIHGRAKSGIPGNVGCISLGKTEASDIFSILSVGSQVRILR